jgi:SAM-dependent methyltransferase
VFVEWKGMQLFQCDNCKFVWLDPLPDGAQIISLYDDAYSNATSGYFGKVPSKLARSRKRARYIVDRLSGGAHGKSFLDVGANGGFMAKAAQEIGFDVAGIEPDVVSVAYAREHYPGIAFQHGLLENADFGSQLFDVIYCSEVIEHVADCNRFAAKLASLLRPGGLLYITTPDVGHWHRPRDVTRWDAFCPPSHCIYFRPGNLKMLLENHGFDVLSKRFAWKPGIKFIASRKADQPAASLH